MKSYCDMNESAFEGCETLEMIYDDEADIDTIGDRAFFGCKNLKEIQSGAWTVTSIGESAFEGCTSLTAFQYNYYLRHIGKRAFAGCTALASFYHNKMGYNKINKMTEISDEAFFGCTSLTEFPFEACINMTKIGDLVFAESGLEAFTPLHKVTEIGKGVCFGCENLTTIAIPEQLKEIPAAAFSYCPKLQKVEYTLSEAGNAISLQTIGEEAFIGCESLTLYPFGNTVTEIAAGAFQGTGLKKVLLNEELTSIGDHAFGYYDNIDKTPIKGFYFICYADSVGLEYAEQCPDWVVEILDTDLLWTEYTDKNGDTAIRVTGTKAKPDQLNVLNIPKMVNGYPVKEVGGFSGYTELREVILPDSVAVILADAFSGCDSLHTIHLPANLTEIETAAFKGCASLAEIALPANVTAIRKEAFSGCTSLKRLDLPNMLYTLGDDAFAGCTALEHVYLQEHLAKIGTPFRGCTALKTVIILRTETLQTLNPVNPDIFAVTSDDLRIACYQAAMKTQAELYGDKHIYQFLDGTKYSSGRPIAGSSLWRKWDAETGTLTILPMFDQSESDDRMIPENFHSSLPADIASAVEHVILEEGVTAIGKSAFAALSKLKNVTFPESLVYIADKAFYNVSSLLCVELPDSLREDGCIGEKAFGYHSVVLNRKRIESKITGFTICAKQGSAGETYATENELKYVRRGTRMDKINSYYKYHFDKGTGELHIWYDEEITDMKPFMGYAFGEHGNFGGIGSGDVWYDQIKTVTIEDGIDTIDFNAFTNCPNLETVTLSDFTMEIGSAAFKNCPKLTTCNISPSLYSIGYDAFKGTALQSPLFIGSNTEIGKEALGYAADGKPIDGFTFVGSMDSGIEQYVNSCNETGATFEMITLLSDYSAIAYRLKNDKLTIYKYLDEGDTTIPDYLFTDTDRFGEVYAVDIMDGVTEISKGSFSGLPNLEMAHISGTVETIGQEAFADCNRLYIADLYDGIQTLGDKAFYGCNAMAAIYLPEGLTEIGEQAIGYNSAGTTIYPFFTVYSYWNRSSTRPQYEYAAENNLGFVQILNDDMGLCAEADGDTLYIRIFDEDCDTVLRTVGFSDNPDSPWRKDITAIVIEEGITGISSGALANFAAVQSIQLPQTLTTLDDGSFYGCSALTTITLPEGIPEIPYMAFARCTALESIALPDSVTQIDESAFADCAALQTVTLSEETTTIGKAAFWNCPNLTAIEIPASVTEIGEEALGYCSIEKGEPFTIYGYGKPDSASYQYAMENGLEFVALDAPETTTTTTETTTTSTSTSTSTSTATSTTLTESTTSTSKTTTTESTTTTSTSVTSKTTTETTTTTSTTVTSKTTTETTTTTSTSVTSKTTTESTTTTSTTVTSKTTTESTTTTSTSVTSKTTTESTTTTSTTVTSKTTTETTTTTSTSVTSKTTTESTTTTSTTVTSKTTTESTTTTSTTVTSKTTTESTTTTSTSVTSKTTTESTTTTSTTVTSKTTTTESTTSTTTTETTTETTVTTTTTTQPIPVDGDLNGDGKQSIADAVLLMRILSEDCTIPATAAQHADCDHDGMVTLMDVDWLMKQLKRKPE